MLPTTIEALVIVALVLSPGYIFTQVARRIIAHIEEPTDVRFLLTIIAAGTAIHALMFPWTSLILDYYISRTLPEHRWAIFIWAVVVAFLVPSILGVIVGQLTLFSWVEKALDFVGLGYIDRMPSAWDFVMRKREANYLRIHLKDGKGMIGGSFASASFGSLDPKRADVYLEQAWQLDDNGTFLQPIADTRGLWIAHDVMAYVHFLQGTEKPHGEESKQQRQELEKPAEVGKHADPGYGQAGRPADRDGEALPPAPDAAARPRPEGQLNGDQS